jgi:phosphoribosylformylglycinamidine synthase
MVGLLDRVKDKMTLDFKAAGDHIYLLGKSNNDINSSEYLQKIRGVEFSPAPQFDLEEEFALQQLLSDLIRQKLVESAHDISEGGLFVTLLESCFNRRLGVDVVAADYNLRKDAYWFGESQSRVVVSIKSTRIDAFRRAVEGYPHEELGNVTTGSVEIDGMNWGHIESWKVKYDTAIEKLLAGATPESALTAI